MKTYVCEHPRSSWHPTLHRVEGHHNPPRSWTTDDGASSEILTICGLCHNEIHSLLNEYLRHDGTPPASVLKTYRVWYRKKADEAWQRRRTDKPVPYTTAHGAAEEDPG